MQNYNVKSRNNFNILSLSFSISYPKLVSLGLMIFAFLMLLLPSGAYTQDITMGETAILPTADSGNGNLLVAQSTTLSQTATIQSLSFYVSTASGNLRLGIYDATGLSGGPGIKKAETNSFTPITGWNTATVITPVSLTAGTYWLAYLPSDNSLAFVKNSDASSSGKHYSFTYGAMPATYSTSPNSTASHWSFYATLSTGPDTTPPTLSNGSPSGTIPSTTSTTLSLTTNENATCKYSSTAGTSYASMPNTFSTTGGTNHSVTISGLSSPNSYSYYVRCQDTTGNANTSDYTISFTVAVPDIQAPTIPANLTATAVSSSQINLSWTASTDNVGVTGYRVERCQGSTCATFTQVGTPTGTTFSDTGLIANTTYQYQVRAADTAGNLSGYSPIANATTQTAETSQLAQLAASMAPGTWAELSTINASSVLGTGGSCRDIICFADSMAWSSATRKIHYTGADHGGVQQKFVEYSEVTNTWTDLPLPYFLTINSVGHGYDQSASNSVTGDYYHNPYTSETMYKYSTTNLTWSALPAAPSKPGTCCDGMAHFPELGGLIWSRGANDVVFYNEGTNTWSTLLTNSGLGSTWMVAEYNPVHKVVLLTSSTRKMYKVSQTGVVTPLADIPAGISIYGGDGFNGVVTVDPVSGDYLVITNGQNRVMYRYNILTDIWTTASIQPPSAVAVNKFVMAVPINTYGVIFFPVCNSGVMDCTVYLYKHSASTLPDTTPPSTPTNLSATAVSSSQINLSWTASTDNVGMIGYRVYHGGTQIATLSSTSYSDIGLSPSTTYSYTVAAVDGAGNISIQSASVQATTQALPPPDTQAPTTPTNLTATAVSSSQINLSWTASTDNVGVTGYRVERCQGANCINFIQVGTPSANSYNDTGLTASTAYTYRVRATDAAGNLSLYSSIVSATTQATGGTSADADFQARCSAAGIIKCWGFDDPATELVLNKHIFAGGSTVPSQDTVIKTSGAGSLKFTLPPPPHGGANMAGKWEPQGTVEGAFGGLSFGEGSTFYTQFRMRINDGMLINTWDSSWKFYEILYNNSTCGNMGIIWVNNNLSGAMSGYTGCGASMVGVAGPGGSLRPPSPPYSIQQFGNGRTCDYPEWYTDNHPDCLYFEPNTWMTFTYKVTFGNKDTANSRIEAWYQSENKPTTIKWLDTGPVYALTGTGLVFNTANFSTYMTNLSSTSGLPGVTSYMWIDEFVISTQPIAAPGATTPPPSTLVGDLNNDRTVNNFDWNIMAGVWFTNDPTADINKDGIVNTADYYYIYANWGKSI